MINISPEVMGKILGYIIIALVVLGLSYGVGAFIAWDYNPGNWIPLARAFTLLGAVMFFAMGTGLVKMAREQVKPDAEA